MNDLKNFTHLHSNATALTNHEAIGILQSKLENLRITLTEKEYRTLPNVRHMEETLKYAIASHRAIAQVSRQDIEKKRTFLEEFPLRLVDRQMGEEGYVHLTQKELTAMLNLDPKSFTEMNILFSWASKYEPIDVESLVTNFVAFDGRKRE